jgi:hypothetical protein
MSKSPLSLMTDIVIQEVARLKGRSDDDIMDLQDIKRLESLAATYVKIRNEIRITKKQSVLESKNLEEQISMVQEALKVLADKSEPKDD